MDNTPFINYGNFYWTAIKSYIYHEDTHAIIVRDD